MTAAVYSLREYLLVPKTKLCQKPSFMLKCALNSKAGNGHTFLKQQLLEYRQKAFVSLSKNTAEIRAEKKRNTIAKRYALTHARCKLLQRFSYY